MVYISETYGETRRKEWKLADSDSQTLLNTPKKGRGQRDDKRTGFMRWKGKLTAH